MVVETKFNSNVDELTHVLQLCKETANALIESNKTFFEILTRLNNVIDRMEE